MKIMPGRVAIALWLTFILACGVVISRTQFTTDLSAFLPRNPTAEQQLLLEQIRDGLASRLILVGIEGSDAPTRARACPNKLPSACVSTRPLSASTMVNPSTPNATVPICSITVICSAQPSPLRTSA